MTSKPYVRNEGNRLILEGSGLNAGHLHVGVSQLHRIVAKKGFQEVIIDASSCTRIFGSFMVPLIAQIERYKREMQVEYEVILPSNDHVKHLFENTGWAHIIAPQDFDRRREGVIRDHLPLCHYGTEEEKFNLVSEVVERILHTVSIERKMIAGIEWVVNEITDNVLIHADSRVGGFMQLTIARNQSTVDLFVADAGKGIPATVTATSDDEAALLWSIKEGHTRDKSIGAGNGLFGSFQLAVKTDGGYFQLDSAHASLRAGGGQTHTRRLGLFQGTSVCCRIGYGNPDALRNALGPSLPLGNPAYDYIESKYGTEQDGVSRVDMHEDALMFGSRHGGRQFRTKLQNLLQASREVELDFSKVEGIISSSFADEAIAKIAVEMGLVRFMQRVKITGMSATVEHIVNRAIQQRLASPQDEEETVSTTPSQRKGDA